MVFVADTVNSIVGNHPHLCQQLLERFIEYVDQDTSVDEKSVKALFSMLVAHSRAIFTNPPGYVASLLSAMTRLPCRRNGGLLLLLGSNLTNLCSVVDWKGVEKPLVSIVVKFEKEGHAQLAIKLVKDLAGPDIAHLACHGDRLRVCSAMANQICQAALEASSEKPSVQSLLDLFDIAGAFCPSFMHNLVTLVSELDVDDFVTPICLALQENSDNDSLRTAAMDLASVIRPVLDARVSTPLGNVTNWSGSARVEATLEEERINRFLISPCKESISFELAKHSHERMLTDLKPLMQMGVINAYPSRPSGKGRWSMKIDKLKSKEEPLENALQWSCTCYSCDKQCILQFSAAKVQQREDAQENLAKIATLSNGKLSYKRIRAARIEAMSRKKPGNGW